MDTTDWSLLAKYVQGEADADETKQMQSWLAEDPSHRELLKRVQAAWQASGDVYQAYAPDTTAAWQAIARRTNARRIRRAPVVARSMKTRRRTWLLRAAVVAGLALGLVFLGRLLSLTGSYGLAEVRTGVQETKQLTLADGTQVWLNERSTLRYDKDFDDSVRAVYLSGEAFFDVARNEAQPFRIASQGAVVRVLGTSFNVRAESNDTAVVVTVVSGTVRLADQNDQQLSVTLEKGEQGVYQVDNRSVTQAATVAPNALVWHTRRLDFQNRSLSEVGPLLEEVYQRTVVVDQASRNLRLTARFDDQPLEEVLEVIALTLNVRYRVEGDTIYFKK